jgi:hypothetical protein
MISGRKCRHLNGVWESIQGDNLKRCWMIKPECQSFCNRALNSEGKDLTEKKRCSLESVSSKPATELYFPRSIPRIFIRLLLKVEEMSYRSKVDLTLLSCFSAHGLHGFWRKSVDDGVSDRWCDRFAGAGRGLCGTGRENLPVTRSGQKFIRQNQTNLSPSIPLCALKIQLL